MKIVATNSQVRAIKQGERNFTIVDGHTLTPRAGFEINPACPREYRMIISMCLNNGWLKPVAHVAERELLFMGLTKEN
jgi:hypothetical protein